MIETTDVAAEKKILRKTMLQMRRSVPLPEVKMKSEAIFHKLIELPAFKAASIVMCYAALQDEVQTYKLIEFALAQGKTVGIPFIQDRAGIMDAVVLKSLDDLVEGTFDILSIDAQQAQIIDPKQIDLVLVPGVAFDETKHRLGVGGGFYDRFLARTKQAFCLGLAFECQIVEKVPCEIHDHTVNAVLTELRLFGDQK